MSQFYPKIDVPRDHIEGGLIQVDDLEAGAVYLFAVDLPAGYKGHAYRFHRLVQLVPVFQALCLVEALTGEDKGLWFVCTVANFCLRYKRCERAAEEPRPTKVAGAHSAGEEH